MQVKHILSIKNMQGTRNKQEYLGKVKADASLVELLGLAYNPFLNFGIKTLKLTKASEVDPIGYISTFLTLCYGLANKNVNSSDIFGAKTFLESLTKDTQGILLAIITKKLSIGLAGKGINKVIPNSIPEFKCMLADTLPKTVEKSPFIFIKDKLKGQLVLVQEKMDGVRCICVKKEGKVTFFTRKGNTIPLKNLEKILLNYPNDNFVLDGELLLSGTARKDTSGKINSLMKGGYRKSIDDLVEFYVFDSLYLSEWEAEITTRNTYLRLLDVVATVDILGAPFYVVESHYLSNEQEMLQFYAEIRNNGGEGVILKDNVPYEWKRSRSWLKVKAVNSCTLKVIGFTDGAGKNLDKVGSVVCRSSDGTLEVSVNPKTDEMRDYITDNRDIVAQFYVEVLYNELIESRDGKYSLFLPRFSDNWVRLDKFEADSLEKIQKETN